MLRNYKIFTWAVTAKVTLLYLLPLYVMPRIFNASEKFSRLIWNECLLDATVLSFVMLTGLPSICFRCELFTADFTHAQLTRNYISQQADVFHCISFAFS